MAPPKVELEEIIGAIQMTPGEFSAYLDRQTGKVVTIEAGLEDQLDEDAPLDSVPEWQREEIEQARLIHLDAEGRFVALPDQFDAHEWQMMSSFANGLESEGARERLLNAIHGKGAFRMFKDALGRMGLIDAWHQFKDQAYRNLAIEWCKDNGIEWVDSRDEPREKRDCDT